MGLGSSGRCVHIPLRRAVSCVDQVNNLTPKVGSIPPMSIHSQVHCHCPFCCISQLGQQGRKLTLIMVRTAPTEPNTAFVGVMLETSSDLLREVHGLDGRIQR